MTIKTIEREQQAIEAAAKKLDPLAFEDPGSVPPRGYECHTPQELNRVIQARRRHAISVAKKMVSAYLAVTGLKKDAERLDKMQEIFVKGDEVHIIICNNELIDCEHECGHETHPHFEAFNWSWRREPVRANTLRGVIDAAIDADMAREGE